jgi:hypothetical protein
MGKDGHGRRRSGNALWQEKRREDALRDAEYEVVRFTMSDYKQQAPWIDGYRRVLARSAARTLHP